MGVGRRQDVRTDMKESLLLRAVTVATLTFVFAASPIPTKLHNEYQVIYCIHSGVEYRKGNPNLMYPKLIMDS